jgi:hypothetical protein
LEDNTGVTALYPSLVSVTVSDPSFPAAVALAKCGRRGVIGAFDQVWNDRISLAGRERLARTFHATDPETASYMFHERYRQSALGSKKREALDTVARFFN